MLKNLNNNNKNQNFEIKKKQLLTLLILARDNPLSFISNSLSLSTGFDPEIEFPLILRIKSKFQTKHSLYFRKLFFCLSVYPPIPKSIASSFSSPELNSPSSSSSVYSATRSKNERKHTIHSFISHIKSISYINCSLYILEIIVL